MIQRISYLLTVLTLFNVDVSQAQQWQILGRLKMARAFFQLERISESKLLVIGGQVGSGTTNTCEIIDMETGAILPAASMKERRSFFGSVVMPDGRVVVVGSAKSIEVYDPKTNVWRVVGEMLEPYSQVCATLVGEHQVLIIGGWTTSQCELFDLVNGRTTDVADFPYVTSQAKAFTTAEGRVFCFSGRSGGPGSFRSTQVHEFLPSESKWVVSGLSAGKLYYPSMVRTQTGKFVWVGGSFREGDVRDSFIGNVAVFDNGGFTNLAMLNEGRAGHGAADVRDGRVIAVGGMDNFKKAKKSCEFVNIVTGEVTQAPTLNVAHGYFLAGDVSYGGKTFVVAVSGTSGDELVPEVEILEFGCDDPSSNIDLLKEPMRTLGAARKVGDKLALTDTAAYSAGAAWLMGKVKLTQGFDTRFTFTLSSGTDHGQVDGGAEGADGVVLVLQNRTMASLGDAGMGLGYEGIPHGLAVEFDSYRNAAFGDPSGNHVAVQLGDGNKLSPNHTAPFLKAIAFSGVPSFKADGSKYYARVTYDGNILNVYISSTSDYGSPVITLPINLKQELSLGASETVYMGLTSATGFSVQRHEIELWEISGCGNIVSDVNDDNSSESQAPFTIQPSPAREYAQLVFRESVTSGIVQIVDVNGAIVWTTLFAINEEVSLPVQQLASGMYAVRVVCGHDAWTQMWSVVR